MCQPVINPAGRVRELSPSSPVVPSGAPQFGSWLPSPLTSRELAPGYRGAGRNIWVSGATLHGGTSFFNLGVLAN